jgi:hypothetical protein
MVDRWWKKCGSGDSYSNTNQRDYKVWKSLSPCTPSSPIHTEGKVTIGDEGVYTVRKTYSHFDLNRNGHNFNHNFLHSHPWTQRSWLTAALQACPRVNGGNSIKKLCHTLAPTLFVIFIHVS